MKINSSTAIMIADGSYHDVYDLKPQTFSLDNIAIALGNICRWGGHLGTKTVIEDNAARAFQARPEPSVKFKSLFYSIAEHSILGAQYHLHRGERELAKLFMLHDAGEPFIGGDIATPLKNKLPLLNEWESEIQDYLINAYSLKGSFDDIKETDRRICRNETIGLFNDKAEWAHSLHPLCYESGFDRELIKLHKWSPEKAMNEWYELAIKLGLENKYVT